MAITTPDKPKGSAAKPVAVDIMDARWAQTPVGYDKAPGPSAAAPDGKAPAETTPVREQPAATTPATARDTSPQPQYATGDTPTPARPEPDASAQAQPAAMPDAHPAQKPIAVSLASLFLPATDVTAWRAAHGMTEHYDYATAERARLKENAMTAGIIDNGFTAERISATHALPGDRLTGAENESEKLREEREKRERNRILMYECGILLENVGNTILSIKSKIENVTQERDAMLLRLGEINQELSIAYSERDILAQESEALIGQKDVTQNKMRSFREERSDLMEKYEAARAENRARFGSDDSGDTNANPKDEVLRQSAWEKNRADVKAKYEAKGLGAEFETLEKWRNGEPVDQDEAAAAFKKARANRLHGDLDADMSRVDPKNAFFKTESGLRTKLRANTQRITETQDDLNRIETSLKEKIAKLETCNDRIAKLEGEQRWTEEQIAKHDAYLDEQKQKLEKAEALKQKLEDYKEGKLSNREYLETKRELRELDREIQESDERYKAETGYDPGTHARGTPEATSAHMTAPENSITQQQPATPDETRTGTSAAGLVSGSSMEKVQGSLTTSFTAAVTASPAPAPGADADPAMTVAAAEQQRRAAPVAGMNV